MESVEVSAAKKAGYSGVATFSKEKILDTKKLANVEFDDEGRTLIHDVGPFFLLNCYFPNGQRDHNRVPFKLDYCRSIEKKVATLQKKKPVIITGDFNTAHHPIDLANPKTNKDTTGFLPHERAWVDDFMSIGMVDIFRHFSPDQAGAYTWWSNRPGCREKNIGWRIDYFFVTKDLIPAIKEARIHADVMGSDHCPFQDTIYLMLVT
jgi:exodeoxyribonuclease-3